MEAIKDTVRVIMKDLVTKKDGGGNEPSDWLKKALTKEELRHIRFNYFKKGVLGAVVDSSSWLYNMDLKKGHLLAELRRRSSAIKDISFRLGEV